MSSIKKAALPVALCLLLTACGQQNEEIEDSGLPSYISSTTTENEAAVQTELQEESGSFEVSAAITTFDDGIIEPIMPETPTESPSETEAPQSEEKGDETFVSTDAMGRIISPTVTTPVHTAEVFPVTSPTTVTEPPKTAASAAEASTAAATEVSTVTTPPPASATIAKETAPKASETDEVTGAITTVPEAPVRTVTYSEYFSDSLFVGDSICSGLKLYAGLLNVENVAARINVSTWGINKYTFQYMSNSTAELDVYSIVAMYQPKDIYIWMGMNDLYCISSEKFCSNMQGLADEFIRLSPESKVHIVSITPMCSWHKWNVELDGNNKVNEYNEACREYCEGIEYMDYINIHDGLLNESGSLDESNHGGDGMHLSASAYKKVLDMIISSES